MIDIPAPYVPLIIFGAVVLVALAGLLLFRDLGRARQTAEPEPTVERLAINDAPPRTAIARFDRWFESMIGEGDLGITPLAGFLASFAVGMVVGGLLFLWRDNLLLAAIGVAAGMGLMFAFFSFRQNQRRQLMQEQFPDVIELLARAVRAGETLDQAIELVGTVGPQPLAQEFRRCGRQLEMGLSMDAAMRTLIRRVPITETRILGAALTVQRRTGGNLPLTLERLARVIRDRLHYRRQFRAATASGRTSTYVMAGAAVLVIVYLMIWRPEYIQTFLETGAGQIMFATAILLQIIGLTWIANLLRPEY